MALPKHAITEDRNLEAQSSKASEALMRHRWHWTLDESNAERVSLREYAREVGRSFSTIHADANGYALTQGDRAVPISEARERAGMGAETEAATEAVAQARGLSFKHTRQDRPVEVRRVREIARERAEKHGTSVEEEAPKVADWLVRSEKAEETRQAERKERLGLRFVEMEGYLKNAQRKLVDALNMSHDVPWGDEERELLASTVQNVRALLNLIDLALVGAAEVDWDSELAALTKE